eukprot:9473882-Pyramimonas_sp.AAC.1
METRTWDRSPYQENTAEAGTQLEKLAWRASGGGVLSAGLLNERVPASKKDDGHVRAASRAPGAASRPSTKLTL